MATERPKPSAPPRSFRYDTETPTSSPSAPPQSLLEDAVDQRFLTPRQEEDTYTRDQWFSSTTQNDMARAASFRSLLQETGLVPNIKRVSPSSSGNARYQVTTTRLETMSAFNPTPKLNHGWARKRALDRMGEALKMDSLGFVCPLVGYGYPEAEEYLFFAKVEERVAQASKELETKEAPPPPIAPPRAPGDAGAIIDEAARQQKTPEEVARAYTEYESLISETSTEEKLEADAIVDESRPINRPSFQRNMIQLKREKASAMAKMTPEQVKEAMRNRVTQTWRDLKHRLLSTSPSQQEALVDRTLYQLESDLYTDFPIQDYANQRLIDPNNNSGNEYWETKRADRGRLLVYRQQLLSELHNQAAYTDDSIGPVVHGDQLRYSLFTQAKLASTQVHDFHENSDASTRAYVNKILSIARGNHTENTLIDKTHDTGYQYSIKRNGESLSEEDTNDLVRHLIQCKTMGDIERAISDLEAYGFSGLRDLGLSYDYTESMDHAVYRDGIPWYALHRKFEALRNSSESIVFSMFDPTFFKRLTNGSAEEDMFRVLYQCASAAFGVHDRTIDINFEQRASMMARGDRDLIAPLLQSVCALLAMGYFVIGYAEMLDGQAQAHYRVQLQQAALALQDAIDELSEQLDAFKNNEQGATFHNQSGNEVEMGNSLATILELLAISNQENHEPAQILIDELNVYCHKLTELKNKILAVYGDSKLDGYQYSDRGQLPRFMLETKIELLMALDDQLIMIQKMYRKIYNTGLEKIHQTMEEYNELKEECDAIGDITVITEEQKAKFERLETLKSRIADIAAQTDKNTAALRQHGFAPTDLLGDASLLTALRTHTVKETTNGEFILVPGANGEGLLSMKDVIHAREPSTPQELLAAKKAFYVTQLVSVSVNHASNLKTATTFEKQLRQYEPATNYPSRADNDTNDYRTLYATTLTNETKETTRDHQVDYLSEKYEQDNPSRAGHNDLQVIAVLLRYEKQVHDEFPGMTAPEKAAFVAAYGEEYALAVDYAYANGDLPIRGAIDPTKETPMDRTNKVMTNTLKKLRNPSSVREMPLTWRARVYAIHEKAHANAQSAVLTTLKARLELLDSDAKRLQELEHLRTTSDPSFSLPEYNHLKKQTEERDEERASLNAFIQQLENTGGLLSIPETLPSSPAGNLFVATDADTEEQRSTKKEACKSFVSQLMSDIDYEAETRMQTDNRHPLSSTSCEIARRSIKQDKLSVTQTILEESRLFSPREITELLEELQATLKASAKATQQEVAKAQATNENSSHYSLTENPRAKTR